MKRDNGDYNLFKFVGIGLVLFYLFIFIGINFVTVGVDSKEETKTAQTESTKQADLSEYSTMKAKEEDAEILGKFWNEKGHFIVVYNELIKAPEVFQVDFSEWQYMRIGEKY